MLAPVREREVPQLAPALAVTQVWELEQRVTSGHIGDPEQVLEELFQARHGLLSVRTMAARGGLLRVSAIPPAPCAAAVARTSRRERPFIVWMFSCSAIALPGSRTCNHSRSRCEKRDCAPLPGL